MRVARRPLRVVDSTFAGGFRAATSGLGARACLRTGRLALLFWAGEAAAEPVTLLRLLGCFKGLAKEAAPPSAAGSEASDGAVASPAL